MESSGGGRLLLLLLLPANAVEGGERKKAFVDVIWRDLNGFHYRPPTRQAEGDQREGLSAYHVCTVYQVVPSEKQWTQINTTGMYVTAR